MKKLVIHFIVPLLLLSPVASFAQSNDLNISLILLKEERSKFLRGLKTSLLDPNIVRRITRFGESEVDYIQQFILSAPIDDKEKEKAIRSLFSFIRILSENISQPKVEMYDIPQAVESYQVIMKKLINKKPIDPELMKLDPWSSQMLADAFRQYKEYKLLEDVGTYKRMASLPDYILPFIENKPGFQFNDSLIMTVAAHDPLKMASSTLRSKPALQSNIRNSNNVYLKQIAALAGDRNAPELMPFLVQLAEQRITPEEIMKQRTDVKKYYQLLVNTLIAEVDRTGTSSFLFHQALRNGLKDKSLAFYVNQVNELHDAKDAVRFASVKGMRAEDLYYIITSSEEEMYTSSYLGLYRRLMEQFKERPDSIFQLVRYDNFRTFMRIAANYNTLTDFLSRMPHENAADLVKRFVSGIEEDAGTGLEKAMDIADSFTGLDSAYAISEMIEGELRSNLERCKSKQLYFGIRLYNILNDVFSLVKQKGSASQQLVAEAGNYDILERKSLINKNGEIVELVLFYGDEDGNSSFNNFLALYKDTARWQMTKNDSWVTIRSVSEEPVVIYANLPLDYKKELDLQAQDALFAYLKQESIEPVILVHRGHSYHLSKTMAKMKPSVKLAILGSCGGYNKIISVATISPDAHIIVTKKTGSKFINDPMIDEINQHLVNKTDLQWTDVWQNLSARFSKEPFTLNLFNEYIPPARNVGLFVLKLFNSYKRFA